MTVSVISIDPAPSKTSTVCDGKDFCEMEAAQLRTMLDGVGSETLLCWDAPLTGPSDPRCAGERRDFSQRCIESFFSRREFKTPTGISVLPYSGCPHWAITRSLLGLPRTGPWDKSYGELPFRLLPYTDEEEHGRPAIVEIHPAVAAWLWCKKEKRPRQVNAGWLYKKNREIREWMWDVIRRKTADVPCRDLPKDGDDDQFDAAVGYLLGVLYLKDRARPESSRRVILLGDRATGSFLVPNADRLRESWEEFVQTWPNLRNR